MPLRIIISSKEVTGRLLRELAKEGFQLTQATLSRDLEVVEKWPRQPKLNENYVYELPNNTMYKRMTEQHWASENVPCIMDFNTLNFRLIWQ